ncbi:hypothetical protein DL765_010029 [Monosporascus sp. GIB2]|nr:hypothetical protein DL765_010029 [Monosporascus sp. GIB2]
MSTAPHCISAEVHDRIPGREHFKISGDDLDPRRVSNQVIHYFGCLEFCERETYFRKLDAREQDLIRDQLRRVDRLKSFVAENWTSATPSQPGGQSSSSHTTQINDQQNSDQPGYTPDKDVKGYLIQYKMHNLNPNDIFYTGEDLIELGRSPDRDENGQGLDPEQQRTAIWKGEFPDQKAIVYDLLQRPVDENSEPGKHYMSRDYQQDDAQRLRYFHFPANNMKWVEDAMSRYYDEKDVQFNNGQPNAIPIARTQANTVLRHELWKGQQHLGNTSFIHARHLRPLCELVSSDRQRHTFSKKIDKLTEEKKRRDQDAEWEATEQRRKEMSELLKDIGITVDDIDPPKREETFRTIDTFSGAVVAQSRKHHFLFRKRRTVTRDNGRLRLKNKLAQLLYDAFRLMEEMENYRDSMMLETYLHHSSPLHPRRTLDQAYYCSVKSTRSRDRDQVVYRETTPKEDTLHSWDYGKNGKVVWKCNGSDGIPKRCLADINNMDLYARKYTKLKTRCPKCASAKRHRLNWKRQPTCPRDDESTSDESDNETEDENTSNGSDKRTKGKTGCILCGSAAIIYQQPRVLDMFSEAIGRVTHNQTLAFNHMWESAEKLRHASSAPSTADLSDLHIPLLNIAPEGMLQREIKDILDELSIMIHLVEQQRDVLRKFVKNATTIICEPKGRELEEPELSRKKKWFETSAQELLSDVDGHLLELATLKQSATSTSEGLDQLLTLKQQQASVIQAWQSIRHGEEAVKQGRAIMIFTTMTIIFLPLAFIAAIFGMNNPELDPEVQEIEHRAPMSLWMQLKLMFGISISIIVLVMILAFSNFARAFCWSVYYKSITWLLARFGLYRIWLHWSPTWKSESQLRLAEAYVEKTKARESQAARKRFAHKVEETHRLAGVRLAADALGSERVSRIRGIVEELTAAMEARDLGRHPSALQGAVEPASGAVDGLVEKARELDNLQASVGVLGYRIEARTGQELGRQRNLVSKGSAVYIPYPEATPLYNINSAYQVRENGSCHGICQVMFHRAHLLTALYESLSEADKACILTNKEVTEIATNEHGVEVRCGDGSTYHGSIIIGADGVHSKVRQSMRELAIQSSASEVNKKKPYLSEYRVLWCTFPRQPDLETGDAIESHGTDVSLQCFNGHDRSWIFIYERLEKPTRDRVSYSQEDVEALAARCGDLSISEHVKVKDVFPKRYTAGMANLEEGIVKHWSWNRIVLVGDACHKLTPNQGLGYNNGIQDVVALVNELHHIMPVCHSGNTTSALDALTGVFSRYQATRMELLRKDYDSSASWTRMSAWRNWKYRLLDRYLLPSIPGLDGFMLTYVIAGKISKGLVLNYVESGESFQGKVPWKNVIKSPNAKLAP